MLDGAGIDRAVGGGRRAHQRPAAGILHRRGGGAATARAARLALGERHQERAQAGEAVGGDEAQRHQLGQRLLELGAQQAAMLQQLVEEGGAVGGDEIDDSLRLGTGPRAESAGSAIARHSAAWRRGSSVTEVVRTVVGLPVAARAPSRSQVAWPARQRASSHDGR